VKKYINPKRITMNASNNQMLDEPDPAGVVVLPLAPVVATGKQLLTDTISASKAIIIPKVRIFVLRKFRLLI